ncbi:MAG: PorT family protein [Bacteroidales bacterium]|nr:PorT family protein [Bacteroidales bacterium]
MKKLLIILGLCLTSLISVSQQLNYGLYFGTTISRWSGDASILAQQIGEGMNLASGLSGFDFKNKERIGFIFGGFLEYRIMKQLSIRPEINYVQKGTRFQSTGLSSGVEIDMNLIMQNDYIESPFLLKLSLTNNENLLQPYLIGGPGVGYLIISNIKAKATADGDSAEETEEYEGNRELDFNLNIGVGIKFKEGSIELRYQKGLQPILTDEASDGLDIKANFFSINVLIHRH